MGRDKASLPFLGATMVERVAAAVEPAVDEVVVVLREGQPPPAELPFRVARDPAEGLGPLAGLVAGMEAVDAERVFLTACDAPLLKTALVEFLLGLEPGRAAVVPVVDGRWMMTTSVYARATLGRARALLAAGRLRPRFLAEEAGARLVEEAELRSVDPELASFRSCNTPEEYEAALRQAGS